MTEPHVIRLREPWQQTEIHGGIRHRRRFNCPTGLDDSTSVWLVIDQTCVPASVQCNGVLLGDLVGPGPGQFELTGHLAPRNELSIDVTADPADASANLLGAVQLEIRQRSNRC